MYVVGDAIYRVFYHYLGTTGLVDGDFTKYACRNGIANSTTILVTEIGSGYYKITLVPGQSGQWYVRVYETADADAQFVDEFAVGRISPNAKTTEDLSDEIAATESRVRGSIDDQAINEIKQLVQGLYERLNRICK